MPYFTYNGPEDSKELWGCLFVKGEPVFVLDDALAQKCKNMGFAESGNEPASKKEEPPQKKEQARRSVMGLSTYAALSKKELVALAKGRGMRNVYMKRKQEIVDLLIG